MSDGLPDGRDRKALRTAALVLHRMASDMKHRRGRLIPADVPIGYVDAFSVELRSMARLLETSSKGKTVSQAKRAARDLPDVGTPGSAEAVAHRNAVNALCGTVNRLAAKAGLDPYSGMRMIE